MIDLKKHLRELSETPGASGYEARIRDVIGRAWADLVDEQTTDALGSLIATKHGAGREPRKKVLVTAHMDEIALIVTGIEDGFIRVEAIGGIDKRVLLSQPVIVHGERDLPGVIGSRPPHVLPASARNQYLPLEDLVVDTGLGSRGVAKLVRVGDIVTFDQPAVELNKGYLSGKAMDNRVSVAMLTLMLQELQTRSHQWDVIAAATVQEEVTLGGGETVAWRIQPDIAIVVDTTWGTGSGVGEDKGFPLGDGPTLVIGPNAHPKLFDLIMEHARTLEIKVTPEPMPRSSGTEGWAVQVSRDGVPTAILSIPIRNMHSPVEVVALRDIERAARLVADFLSTLDDGTLGKLALDGEV